MRHSITSAAAGGCDPAALAELAAQAERSGWDGFFLEDYLVYQGREDVPTYDPWIALAAMACATTRLTLGTTVTPVSRRRPWQVAAQAITLDSLSGGRFVLGVGSGNAGDVDFATTGEPSEQRELAERLDEGLEIIGGLLAGRRVHHAGRHFQVTGLRLEAAAGRRRRVPLWIGGNLLAPAVRRRIARWDGSCAYKGPIGSGLGPVTPEDVADLRACVARSRGAAARFDIKITAVDDAELLAEFERAGATWAGVWVDPTDSATLRQVITAGPRRV
ncbi:LLM class flavin-dependent oxidoreductase [Microlunatus parietis]|uniref:Alkanesulfonate monooxygenase SsuD/methylene tetrahydromethanopterin reductase-like flavin-dependent oxidoreductase (Luciferase family) n=1 Tax=Microlunatus parietis TaxID=682979 RepID=A0A7Y9I5H0_9ACTN|nr:alkanesulfonate monooxygenase SsuD/methylene tetrahydromethanopterin reductase-like flavin-dependent oxidoreductase (luciferase family) [Microlunatus parietis]